MAAAGKQTGIKKTTVKKQDKGRHKGGITHASIEADTSMSRREKDTIIKILGLSPHAKNPKNPTSRPRTAAEVRTFERRAPGTRSTGRYAAAKKSLATRRRGGPGGR